MGAKCFQFSLNTSDIRRFRMRFLLIACFSSILSAQVPVGWNITANPQNPKVGDTVVLELADLSPSPSLTIDWDDNKSGEGILWLVKSGRKAQFQPTKPGSVTIICILSGGWK